MVAPIIQGPMFVDAPYYDMPDPQFQSSPATYSPSFEEKDLQAFDLSSYPPPHQTNLEYDRFAYFQQMIMTQQQSINESMDRTDQLLIELKRDEGGELPS